MPPQSYATGPHSSAALTAAIGMHGGPGRGATLGAEMLNTVAQRAGAEFHMAVCLLGGKGY